MGLAWLRRLFSEKHVEEPAPAAWGHAIEALPFYGALGADERTKLRTLAYAFSREKSWEGCGGLEVTDAMRVTISAQACLLILNLSHRFYRRVESILLYPSAYRAPDHDVPRAGEAWVRGPVVLAWDEAYEGGRDPDDGRNTVFHEFAHKLDMLDDFADGTPPLAAREHYERWERIVGREYENLVDRAQRGKAALLDTYGATNPAEFFAVATECFFEKPRAMRDRHGELYELLRAFYAQDPARRELEGASVLRHRGRRRGRF